MKLTSDYSVVGSDPEPSLELRIGRIRRWMQAQQNLVDIAVAGFYTLYWVVEIFRVQGAYVPFALTTGIGLSLAVLARRRFPLGTVLAGGIIPTIVTALGCITGNIIPGVSHGPTEVVTLGYLGLLPVLLAQLILSYTVASVRRIKIAAPCILGNVLLNITSIFLLETYTNSLSIAFLYLLAVVLAWMIGANVRIHRLRIRALEQRAQQLALERDQREQLAVSTERARIAREMHDIIAHSLAIMITMADGVAASLEKNPELARKALNELSNTGRAALADARRLVGVLREDSSAKNSALQEIGDSLNRVPAAGHREPPDADTAPGENSEVIDVISIINTDSSQSDIPLAPQPDTIDISELVTKFRDTGIPVAFEYKGNPLPEDPGLRLTAFRIVQESLTNILRYAPASPRVTVSIRRAIGTAVIEVYNEFGAGQTTARGSGKGIIGMKERASVYAGKVEAGPTATGWQVQALLRWEETGEGIPKWKVPE